MRIPGAPGHVNYTQLGIPGAPGHVNYTQLGIPFCLKTGRSGGLARSILLTLVIGFSYFILFYAGLSLGHAGVLPAIIAAWATNVIFLATGVYMMMTVRG